LPGSIGLGPTDRGWSGHTIFHLLLLAVVVRLASHLHVAGRLDVARVLVKIGQVGAENHVSSASPLMVGAGSDAEGRFDLDIPLQVDDGAARKIAGDFQSGHLNGSQIGRNVNRQMLQLWG